MVFSTTAFLIQISAFLIQIFSNGLVLYKAEIEELESVLQVKMN